MKTATILARALVYGGILAVAIAVVGSVVGYIAAGGPGLVSALIGAGLTAILMGLTALSILLETGFPMYIAWGPEYTQFYNDGYRPILGSTKHPASPISTPPSKWFGPAAP